jgi:hypothetical protein
MLKLSSSCLRPTSLFSHLDFSNVSCSRTEISLQPFARPPPRTDPIIKSLFSNTHMPSSPYNRRSMSPPPTNNEPSSDNLPPPTNKEGSPSREREYNHRRSSRSRSPRDRERRSRSDRRRRSRSRSRTRSRSRSYERRSGRDDRHRRSRTRSRSRSRSWDRRVRSYCFVLLNCICSCVCTREYFACFK